MKRSDLNSYTDSEKDALQIFLQAGSGVLAVTAIERHLKGGYAVTLDVEPDATGPLSDYVSSNDLMLVL